MTDLPFIDTHETLVHATPERVWDGAASVISGWGGRFGSVAARALGCADINSDFPRAVAGFRVSRAERPAVLSLRGEHRFAHYQLDFTTRAGPDGATTLRAESRAEFHGASGKLYKGLVIGTHGHVIAVRGLLRAIRRRAERTLS